MADHNPAPPPSLESPFLVPPSGPQNNLNHDYQQQRQGVDRSWEEGDCQLDQTLQKLETFLSFLGFNQSTVLGFVLSWTAFLLVGVVLPVIVVELSDCSDCQEYQVKKFELDIVASQASLAAVSLLCLSHNLRKFGLRKFLFVDRYSGQMSRFRDQYITQIKGSVRLLVIWALPCVLLKTAREIVRIVYTYQESWWLSVYILLAMIISWAYVSTIFLSASILFHLVCNLQVIHLDDYGKLLERESDVLLLIEEHIRLRYYLSKISHRFRIFLLLQFFIVTASQFVTLLQTTACSGLITLINSGDFAVSAIVQVVGIILCLHAATKISSRAQGIAVLASRWHALMTCGSSSTDGSAPRPQSNVGNSEPPCPLSSLHIDYSESDLESLEYISIPTSSQLASYMSTYHKRQAFVCYLQTNPGGITIFGWMVDRALLTTIFFIELSLVTFVLGKTIVFSSS
ncbi:uncharacterized protein LOC116198455 [Punica granatum]|uniref:Uncharacterized protein n=3 Tax=Punica granatum TaxID=22663 RepID=A0A2I0LCD1_PUNGR|nr:uncharacterized protein LOC116198455 [Punica granatum]PKI78332.1 hypothetical protein CRG98_001275 [Punica granatum]